MIAVRLHHVAFVVPNLEEAIERYEKVFNLPFDRPIKARLQLAEHNTSGPVDLHVAYSSEGPMHIELIENTGDGTLGTRHGLGFHHVGGFVGDLPAALTEFEFNGVHTDATVGDGHRVFTAFLSPDTLHGFRLEANAG
jgi:catechol 2,3-dioxygenase-like lactoylglutathione lyase family enzyme